LNTQQSTLRSRFGDLRGRALLIVFGALLCQMGLGFAYVLSPLAGDIIEEFGWSRTMYSSARAPQLFVIAAMSPIVGTLAVRFGALAVLATGAVSMHQHRTCHTLPIMDNTTPTAPQHETTPCLSITVH
jgi:ABC-type phosphate transport system permease subunit